MLDRDSENTAPQVLTEEQLERVAGGVTVDPGGNVPICPPWFPGRPGGFGPIPPHRT